MTNEEALEKMADLWQFLNEKQRCLLSKKLILRHYKQNEWIYRENDIPNQLLCLLKGKIKVTKCGITNRNQIIRVVKPIEYFGYRAYFAGENYVTAASAFEPSIVGMIPMENILQILNANNRLALFFMRELSIYLGNADSRTLSLTQKHIRGRLAESLLLLKHSYGFEEDDSTLTITPTREDLANLSNMNTANAIRTLSDFAAEGLIAVNGRRITILREDELKKISRLG